MKLSQLIKGPLYHAGIVLPPAKGQNVKQPDPEIRSIHYHAEDVKPGGLFVAIPGFAKDGHDYIDAALRRGAVAFLTQKPIAQDALFIQVENTRQTLAAVAARFYQEPSAKLKLIGITGTNGKTTSAYLIESILATAGFCVGVIGTINYRYAGKTFPNPITTPESLDLQRILHEMLSKGVSHVVMEVSSHALDLHRVAQCWFDLGIFTNLSQDHLDYHGDLQQYWACKKRLFTEHLLKSPPPNRLRAVINGDDAHGQELLQVLPYDCLSVGFSRQHAVRAKNPVFDLQGICANIETPAGAFELHTPLLGRHNLENILLAIGVGLALDLPLDTIKSGIESQSVIPGRLEGIPNDRARFVFVDYAHTPDALANVLSALKTIAARKIICIFGCGGDRDKDKRPRMGAIAAKLCDLVVVTSDNPRSENPAEIIRQIVKGIKALKISEYTADDLNSGLSAKGFLVEPDRKKAIQIGISASASNDVVLIAGKGHETYQIIGPNMRPFDDRQEAAWALADMPLPWSAEALLTSTRGKLVAGSRQGTFMGISIDSRRIRPDDLFIAIAGRNHDGHTFIPEVLKGGLKGLLINKDKVHDLPLAELISRNIFCMAVDDTTRALGHLAAFQRQRAAISVVAITGSNGKTTTRMLTSAVVSQRFGALSTLGNFNNEIGLPLSLLQLRPSHQWAVLELGMNQPGEIGRLTEMCAPDIGVITNIGPVHLEGLGSIDGVLQAKAELVAKMKPTGIVVLNQDDAHLLRLAQQISNKILFFGIAGEAEIRAHSIQPQTNGTTFTLVSPQAEISVRLHLPGRFMVSNALAAAAVGYQLGLSLQEIKTGLESVRPAKGRMHICSTRKGIKIIDDTYNANPVSMAGAMRTLCALRGNNRSFFVSGDMLELGDQAANLHQELGALVARAGVVRLYATGTFAESVAAGAKAAHLQARDIFVGTKAEIVADLKKYLQPGDWMLVKGSRGIQMEQIVAKVREWADE